MENVNKTRKNKQLSKKAASNVRLLISYIILFVLAIGIIVPFYVILISSFKPGNESQQIPFTWWPTSGFLDFSGYAEVLFSDKTGGGGSMSSIVRGLINTLIIVVPSTIVGLLISALSAYAFAKMKFKGKNILFYMLIATLMIPGIVMLSPAYMIYDAIGLTDTFFPLMVPGMFGSAICMLFLKQFFTTIPNDLLDAAKLDGLGHFKIFWRIIIPLSAPALIAQGILGFVGGYNDYFGPLIYLQTPDNYTLQIALSMFQGTYTSDYQVIMAGAVLSLIPTVVIFIFCQKYFISGITMSGMKG